jgi:hypothetical protein
MPFTTSELSTPTATDYFNEYVDNFNQTTTRSLGHLLDDTEISALLNEFWNASTPVVRDLCQLKVELDQLQRRAGSMRGGAQKLHKKAKEIADLERVVRRIYADLEEQATVCEDTSNSDQNVSPLLPSFLLTRH